ncbi:SIR2 family protein [Brevibacillus laterosporus]|uniref:SIR2 family protein n=1 Tax=Brevibacillus laterosporus TaxID=1465 RepID=UPI0035A61EFA
MSYRDYIIEVSDDIRECLNEMGTQPILFVGSGLSQRFFNGPSWLGLLGELKKRCPIIPHEVGFYLQDGFKLEDIGSEFTTYYRDWAWSNQEHYPSKLFDSNISKDTYIKYEIGKLFEEITPLSTEQITDEHHIKEIELLRDIQPHAIITTNYDTFLEKVFPDYQPIVGQQILKPSTLSIGELFKIHGCVTNIHEMVFNTEDYDVFITKKKYLSAKLLTFFAEHPLLFVGYSGNDKNILTILSDIDEIISNEGELISNIYFLAYNKNLSENSRPPKEKVFVVNGKEIRVKYIESNNYDWIFEAFAANKAVDNVHPKLLRALLARTYKLVRSDIPRRSVDVNFEMIERVVNEDEALPNLYGVALLDNPSQINVQFPFTLTQVAEQLGYTTWHNADKLISRIRLEKGINIKASDNNYHVTIKIGKTEMNKYSQEAVKLLSEVRDHKEYRVDI